MIRIFLVAERSGKSLIKPRFESGASLDGHISVRGGMGLEAEGDSVGV